VALNHIINRKRGSRSIIVRAVGDLNFSGATGRRLMERGDFNPVPEIHGILGRAQVSLFNLECVPTADPEVTRLCSNMTAPAFFLDQVRREFNVAGIANNHITDAGAESFLDAIEELHARNFVIVGGGRDIDEADSMHVVIENDVRIGIIACADFVYGPHRGGNNAGENKPGVSIYDPKRIARRIARDRDRVDILVCSLHTGLEFHRYPDPALMRDARIMIDSGANIVLVHHAHVRQGIESYNEGLIAYGLGNFIFDPSDPYMQREDARTDIGLVVDIFVDTEGIAEYAFWLSRIMPDGTTRILTDIKGNIELYEEQLKLNAGLSDPALVRSEWRAVCRRYFKERCYILYRTLIKGDFPRFLHLLRDLRRRENRRWIKGLLGH
jgi:hypothetical protein